MKDVSPQTSIDTKDQEGRKDAQTSKSKTMTKETTKDVTPQYRQSDYKTN